MLRWMPIVAVASLVLSSGCSGAGASEPSSEGDASHAAPPPAPEGGAGPEAGTAAVTWTSLYAEYFGPAGVASCAGSGTCHGSAEEAGYMASMYLCPPGDKDGCYMGITSSAAGLITPGAFDGTKLYANLR